VVPSLSNTPESCPRPSSALIVFIPPFFLSAILIPRQVSQLCSLSRSYDFFQGRGSLCNYILDHDLVLNVGAADLLSHSIGGWVQNLEHVVDTTVKHHHSSTRLLGRTSINDQPG